MNVIEQIQKILGYDPYKASFGTILNDLNIKGYKINIILNQLNQCNEKCFTRKEIMEMSNDQFVANEELILRQIATGLI